MKTQARLSGLILLAVVLSAASCPPTTTSLTPMVATLARSVDDIYRPVPNCSRNMGGAVVGFLNPLPGASQWWTGLSPTAPARVAGNGTAGFQLLFEDLSASVPMCSRFRQAMYRAYFSYDLSGVQNLKGLVKTGELDFFSVTPPGSTSATSACPAFTGGAASLLLVRPTAILPGPVSSFLDLGEGSSFPASATIFTMPTPWSAGPITAGVQTGVTVSTSPTGAGGASFTVDVTSYLNGALNRGDASIAFMLAGTMEATPAPFPSATTDCETTYKFGALSITHY